MNSDFNNSEKHTFKGISESKSELLLRIVPSAIFTVDLGGTVTEWNDMAEQITGYTREEILGQNCSIFTEEPCTERCGLFDNSIEKPVCGAQCAIRTKTGETKYISKNIEYLYNEDGEIAGGIESFVDITSLKFAEKEIKSSEEKFKSIWDKSIDGMRITDADGIVIMVNDAYCEMVGLQEEELIGKPFPSVYNSDQDSLLKKYKTDFVKKILIPRKELQVKLWNNRSRFFSVSQSFLTIQGNEVVLSVLRDITEAKKSELINNVIYKINNIIYGIEDLEMLLAEICKILNKIVNSENFFIALYNAGEDTISIPYLVDKFDEFKSVPVDGTATGYVIKTKESLLMNEELANRLTEEGKIKLVGTASKIWLGVPIRVRQEVIGVVVMQDYENENAISDEELSMVEFISDQIGIAMDRIMSRRELIESEKKLREVNAAKDRFFSILSHDLKNPFITINGYLEILQEDYETLNDEERKTYLRDIASASGKTFELLQTLLTWSRSQRGEIEVNKSKIFFVELVNESLAPLWETAKKKNINLNVLVDNDLIVYTDKFMIETVIRNLVSNSIKFTKEGGTVFIETKCSDDYVIISVRDTGIGMSKETIDKLFRLDEKITSKGTNNEEGTGLGLILCKEFVEKNGGVISVKSVEKKGSEFTIKLSSRDNGVIAQ
jgi:PAS domain S-box-containing protein